MGDFSVLKGFLLFLLQCFLRTMKGQLKALHGLAVVLSKNFQMNSGGGGGARRLPEEPYKFEPFSIK